MPQPIIVFVMTYVQLYKKLPALPAPYQAEVEEFIDFLKAKQQKTDQSKKRPVFGSAKGQFVTRFSGFGELIKT